MRTEATFQLETARLTLREMQLRDAEDLVRLNADPEVVQYTGDGPFENLEAARSLVRNYRQYRDYRMGRWLLHLKTSGEFIGWCGLKFHPEENVVDLGYRLLKKHWGQGYATEASEACLRYGFAVLGLDRVVANAMSPNAASLRVMQKVGMRPVADATFLDGCEQQCAITRAEWQARQPTQTAPAQ